MTTRLLRKAIIPALILAVAADGLITRIEGLAVLLLFIPYVINVFLQEREEAPEAKKELLKEIEIELDLLGFSFGKLKSPWIAFVAGLLLLLAGANIFTGQLLSLARQLHIEEGLIGMSIGAIGPSIPNIVAAYQSTQKGMIDIAISGTLGSNVFTLLVTLGILAFLSPVTISQKSLLFDIPYVIIMSFALFIFMITDKKITKTEGIILIAGYMMFLVMQFVLGAHS